VTGDVNSDGIATAFESEIYGSSKGRLRLAVLWTHLLESVPGLSDGGRGRLPVRLVAAALCDLADLDEQHRKVTLGSPLSAVPLAVSTSSLAVRPPGTPSENALITASPAVARARIRSRRLIDSSIW
jgi:hypothetical protein